MSLKSKLEYLLDTKTAIKDAIANKDQTIEIDDNTPFREYAAKITAIETVPDNALFLDGVTAKMPVYGAWRFLVGANGKFYSAINNSNILAYSEDSITWELTTLPVNGNWANLIYGNGRYVAICMVSNDAAYSDDGITWTATTMPSPGGLYLIYENGKFVTWYDNYIMSSDDGINWIKTMMTSDVSLIFGNGKFVAYCTYQSDSRNYYTQIFCSEDAVNWTESVIDIGGVSADICYGNNRFVVISFGGDDAYYSDDGVNWNQTIMSADSNWSTCSYLNDKFIATAYVSDMAAYSYDGITWRGATLPKTADWLYLFYGNNKYVAYAYDGSIACSDDGITWTSGGSFQSYYKMQYINGLFLAYRSNDQTMYYSNDCMEWTQSQLPCADKWLSFLFYNNKIVTVGNGSATVIYSLDGITWIQERAKLLNNSGEDITDVIVQDLDANLFPENIIKDKTIFGITGIGSTITPCTVTISSSLCAHYTDASGNYQYTGESSGVKTLTVANNTIVYVEAFEPIISVPTLSGNFTTVYQASSVNGINTPLCAFVVTGNCSCS